MKREVSWDLSEMFASTTDPSIQEVLDKVTKMAEDFEAKYKARLESLSAKDLLKCFQDYEDCMARRADITLFAFLSFAANMTLPDTQALHDKVRKATAEVDKKRAFFKIELGNLLKKKPEVINDRALANYRHFLEKIARELPHQVSEAEEKLIIEKDQYGVKAWEEMQQKWLNTRVFKVKVEGKMKTLSYGEAFGLLSHHDRATRKSAVKSIGAVLGKDGEIFVSALRNVCNDWIGICERRKYESPMEASLIRDDLARQTVENLLKALEEHAPLYQHQPFQAESQVNATAEAWLSGYSSPHTRCAENAIRL
jgi:oligoendopeptidase F